jgi:outer membrane protein assembly factor BamB
VAEPTRRPLRIWPGVVIVALQWLVRFGVPAIDPELLPLALLSEMVGALGVLVWWAFFSRIPHPERWGGIALIVLAMLVTPRLVHESVATGMMGALFVVYAIPTLCLALVLWALLARNLAVGSRRAALALAIVAGVGVWALFKTGGFTSDLDQDWSWRWARTAEDRLVARTAEQAPDSHGAPVALPDSEPEWPGFRGPARNDVVHGVRIRTDWSTSPPVELWRRAVGPGWSSFAVHGRLIYTQEQRGDDELVACYERDSGDPVWEHRDPVRFWEANGGAGPRGTPALRAGKVYTLGGTGVVNALDAADGAVIWSRDAAKDTGAELPVWGFSGSPLAVGGQVVVAASGSLVSYDAATGEPRWTGPAGGEGYSSPHLLRRGGVPQILQLSGDGLTAVAPADGSVLWEHEWSGYPIVQPATTADGDVLIGVTAESGLRRLSLAEGPAGWTVDERWTSQGLKPYSSDFVVHEGHAYGFDGTILSCIDLADGERRWKGGRYGLGQLLLLADQDLLLVISEKGGLTLVAADPGRFHELARFPAIEGKTWNHPVLVGDTLLVRNGKEMAAFRLALLNPTGGPDRAP